MKFTASEQHGVVVLALDGNVLGGPEATALNEELHRLIDQRKYNVVVDLSQVSLMNSSGLGMLIGGYTTIQNAGGMLKIACANEKVRNLIAISKLTNLFTFHPNIDAAIASFF